MAESKRVCSPLRLVIAALISAPLCAQQAAPGSAPPPASAPASTAPASAPTAPGANASLSSKLGLYVFPAKNQTAAQQSTDESSCYGWAKTQSGIDPAHVTPQQPAQQASAPPQSSGGHTVRGAAKGAAAGAAIGAVTGDAGEGAAVGATAGAISGVAQKRRAKKQEAAQQQQADAAAQQQAQASIAQQMASYNKAFSACMEGKGYTVK
jgi:hypothetical protein